MKIFNSSKERWELINKLVKDYQNTNNPEAIQKLWEMYIPAIHKTIGSWKKHFNDTNNHVIEYDDLLQECFIWFATYTKNYRFGESKIGKQAVFSTYIKNNMSARIRYIYQTRLADYNKEQPLIVLPHENYNEKMDILVNMINGFVPSAEDEVCEQFDKIEAHALGVMLINRFGNLEPDEMREMIKCDSECLDLLYDLGYDINALFNNEH